MTQDRSTTGTKLVDTGAAGTSSAVPTSSGQLWTIKNLLELKNAKLVSISGNIFENCWKADQKGYAVQFTPANNGLASWTVVQDVTFQDNTVRHVGAGMIVNGRDTSHGSEYTRNIAVRHNLFTDVSTRWGGPGGFMVAGNGTRDVRVDHNTIDHDGFVVAGNGEANVGFIFTEQSRTPQSVGHLRRQSRRRLRLDQRLLPGHQHAPERARWRDGVEIPDRQLLPRDIHVPG